MKRVLSSFAVVVILAGCNPDTIETTTDIITSETDPDEVEGPLDNIDDVSFTRTVSITWSGASASVEGDDAGSVAVSGSTVTVNNTSSTDVVKYILSGSSSDGSFKLYSSVKQALVLKDLSLASSGGAAINNQSHKRTFVVLEGSSTLSDCATGADGSYLDEIETEDMKAAFFSESQLVFSGSGSLTVNAKGKAAITSDDYLRFMGSQTVNASSTAGHALRGKEAITVDDGTIVASTSADGKKAMTSDGSVTINGGTITLSTSGGTISETVSGKTELTGASCIKSDGPFSITGGVLNATSTGQGGKGISGDSTGSFSGGTVNVTVNGSNYGSSSGGFGSGFGGGPGGGFPGGGFPGGGFSGGGNSGNQGSSDTSKSAKGIKFDGDVTVSGGTISVIAASHEAFESKGKLTVTGGTLYAFSTSDDAINSAGDMRLSGGLVCGWSMGNDGIDANGNMYIDGATVYAVCTKGTPEVALDANTEQQKKLYLQSGNLVAIGGIESGSSITGTAYSTSSWGKSAWHALKDASGSDVLVFKTPASSSNSTMVLYSSGKAVSLQSGVTVAGGTQAFGGNCCTGGTADGGSTVSVSTYSGNSGQRW